MTNKNPTRKYVVLKEYHTREGVVSEGDEVELTDDRAAELSGKVRVKTSAEIGGGSQKELEAANKKIGQLEGDVKSLGDEKTAWVAEKKTLEADVKSLTEDKTELSGKVDTLTTEKTELETKVATLEGQLEEATKPDGSGAGDSGAGESPVGDGKEDTPAESKKGGKPSGKGKTGNGKNNN